MAFDGRYEDADGPSEARAEQGLRAGKDGGNVGVSVEPRGMTSITRHYGLQIVRNHPGTMVMGRRLRPVTILTPGATAVRRNTRAMPNLTQGRVAKGLTHTLVLRGTRSMPRKDRQ